MKKREIIDLIRYYSEKNDAGFRATAYSIAHDFDKQGDTQLAEYIMSMLSTANVFVPQQLTFDSRFLEKVETYGTHLFLPECVAQELLGVVNAIRRNIGLNKFLFQGAPGTGKTEATKQLSKILERELFSVNYAQLVDSRLGETTKNIAHLFEEINSFSMPDKIIVLFDEIDSIALDRTNPNDIREMGRATSMFLKGLDGLDKNIVVIATTNLYEHFDKALLRRFNAIINFNRYAQEDLTVIAEKLLDLYLKEYKLPSRDIRIFRKILNLARPLPYPGELENVIRTAIGFSSTTDNLDYLRRLYTVLCPNDGPTLQELQQQGFTLREMEILTNKSRSYIARALKVGEPDE